MSERADSGGVEMQCPTCRKRVMWMPQENGRFRHKADGHDYELELTPIGKGEA